MYDVFSPCPCCGSGVIDKPGAYEICDVCGWEDDPVQSSNPNFAGGANKLSLLDARSAWEKRDLIVRVIESVGENDPLHTVSSGPSR